MHEAYTVLFDKDFQHVVLKVNILLIVIPSNKTSSLTSTLIELIFNTRF